MTAATAIETTFRQEHGFVLAALIRQLRDFTLAEDALVNALERWAIDGDHDNLVPVGGTRKFAQKLRSVSQNLVVSAEIPHAEHNFD